MQVINAELRGSPYGLFNDQLVITYDLMRAAVKSVSSERECEGLFTLWAKPYRKNKPEEKLTYEMSFEIARDNTVNHPEIVDTNKYDVKLDSGCSSRQILDEAIKSAANASCQLFPDNFARRTLTTNGQSKRHPLTTGYYVYQNKNGNFAGATVMVLNTHGGVFYAGFMANAFDYTSAQNAYRFAIYLFSALVNALCAINFQEDSLMEIGSAELLAVPVNRAEAFQPNIESGLICLDEKYRYFAGINAEACTPTKEFMTEVERRRMRLLEHWSMRIPLLHAN